MYLPETICCDFNDFELDSSSTVTADMHELHQVAYLSDYNSMSFDNAIEEAWGDR